MSARVVAPVSLLLLLALQVGNLPTLHAGTLVQQLVAADGAAGDGFGIDVDVDGDTLVVGAVADDIGGNVDQGSAYVFVRSGGVWTQQAKLVQPPGTGGSVDHFGYRVAISGDTILVGAPRWLSQSFVGRVCVFVRSGGVWTFQASLTPNPGVSGLAGTDVEIEGDTAIVGSTAISGFRGQATIYERSGVNWIVQQTILGVEPGKFFGSSLALDGNTLVIGASPTPNIPGYAKVFVRSGSTWNFQADLPGGMGQVGLSGDTAAITDNHQLAPNRTKVFVRSGSVWSEQADLATPNSRVVDVRGDIALVGAASEFVHVFSRTAGVWTQGTSLTNPESAVFATNFGHNLVFDGTTAFIGVPDLNIGANSEQGAVRIFTDLVPAPPPPPPPPGNTPAPPVPPPTPGPPTGPPPTITAIADQTVLVNGVVGPLSFTVDGRILADALEVTATSSDPVARRAGQPRARPHFRRRPNVDAAPGGRPHGQRDDHGHCLGRLLLHEHAFPPHGADDRPATGAAARPRAARRASRRGGDALQRRRRISRGASRQRDRYGDMPLPVGARRANRCCRCR